MVAPLAGKWTFNSQVMGSSPGWAPLHSGLGQATYTCVPLSPNSIIWYQLRVVISLATAVTAGLVESDGRLLSGLWLGHLWADSQEAEISSEPNARKRVWDYFTFLHPITCRTASSPTTKAQKWPSCVCLLTLQWFQYLSQVQLGCMPPFKQQLWRISINRNVSFDCDS